MDTSRIVSSSLAAVFVVFGVWYGGNGDPLSPDEVDELTDQVGIVRYRVEQGE